MMGPLPHTIPVEFLRKSWNFPRPFWLDTVWGKGVPHKNGLGEKKGCFSEK